MDWNWNWSYAELMIVLAVILLLIIGLWWCYRKLVNERETYEMIYRDLTIPGSSVIYDSDRNFVV